MRKKSFFLILFFALCLLGLTACAGQEASPSSGGQAALDSTPSASSEPSASPSAFASSPSGGSGNPADEDSSVPAAAETPPSSDAAGIPQPSSQLITQEADALLSLRRQWEPLPGMWDIKLSPAYPDHILIVEGEQETETWHLCGRTDKNGYVAVFVGKDPDVHSYTELMAAGQAFLYQIPVETYTSLAGSPVA